MENNVTISDSFGIGKNILLCTTKCMSEDELRNTWRNIRNYVATKYQIQDIDEFMRWNFYIFYIVEDKNAIDRSLKYEIEHDTISSRKIVVNNNEFEGEVSNLEKKYIHFDFDNILDNSKMPLFQKDSRVVSILKSVNNED